MTTPERLGIARTRDSCAIDALEQQLGPFPQRLSDELRPGIVPWGEVQPGAVMQEAIGATVFKAATWHRAIAVRLSLRK